ncbi:MAG: hypothetical protein LBM98_03195 [Oscillospiraceae bacterium]|nr:hypothetical protein [Oscillospiraceae bacterium]
MDVGCAPRGICVPVIFVQTLVLIPSVEGCPRRGGVVSPPRRTLIVTKLIALSFSPHREFPH